MTRQTSRGASKGTAGVSATKSVRPRVLKYTSVATALVFANIFLSCAKGPFKKKLAIMLIALPATRNHYHNGAARSSKRNRVELLQLPLGVHEIGSSSHRSSV